MAAALRQWSAIQASSANDKPQAGNSSMSWNCEERPTKYIPVTRPKTAEKASIPVRTRSGSRRTKRTAATSRAAAYVA